MAVPWLSQAQHRHCAHTVLTCPKTGPRRRRLERFRVKLKCILELQTAEGLGCPFSPQTKPVPWAMWAEVVVAVLPWRFWWPQRVCTALLWALRGAVPCSAPNPLLGALSLPHPPGRALQGQAWLSWSPALGSTAVGCCLALALALKELQAGVLSTFRPGLWCRFGQKAGKRSQCQAGSCVRGSGVAAGLGPSTDKPCAVCVLGSDVWQQSHHKAQGALSSSSTMPVLMENRRGWIRADFQSAAVARQTDPQRDQKLLLCPL